MSVYVSLCSFEIKFFSSSEPPRASWGLLESTLTSWHAVRLVVYFSPPIHSLSLSTSRCLLHICDPLPHVISLCLPTRPLILPSREFSEDHYFLSLPLITSDYCYATRLFPTNGHVVGPNGEDSPKARCKLLYSDS